MGAAGLTCSCSEMAAKGGLGVELDLDRVPARETGMTTYEFLLSESQERMLFVVKAGREDALMQRFRRWGLQGGCGQGAPGTDCAGAASRCCRR